MKTIIALLLLSITSFGQVKTESLIKEKIGTVKVEYIKTTDLDKNETRYAVYLIFQNVKYTTISDARIIGFNNKESLAEFLKDLNAVKTQMDLKEKVNIDWTKDNYSLVLYDFSTVLYIYDLSTTKGNTQVTLKQVEQIIQLLSKIDFGKDQFLN